MLFVFVPHGAQAQEACSNAGQTRWNSTITAPQVCNGATWRNMAETLNTYTCNNSVWNAGSTCSPESGGCVYDGGLALNFNHGGSICCLPGFTNGCLPRYRWYTCNDGTWVATSSYSTTQSSGCSSSQPHNTLKACDASTGPTGACQSAPSTIYVYYVCDGNGSWSPVSGCSGPNDTACNGLGGPYDTFDSACCSHVPYACCTDNGSGGPGGPMECFE